MVPLSEKEDTDPNIDLILTNLGLTPRYSYIDGSNQIVFTLRREQNALTTIVVLTFASIVVGILTKNFVSPEVISRMSTGIVDPLISTFFNALKCIANSFLFLSVLTGIINTCDLATFSKIGKDLFRRFLVNLYLATAVAFLFLPLFKLNFTRTEMNNSLISEVLQVVLDFIPSSVFEPFISGNSIQVLTLAIALGLPIMILKSRAETVISFFTQLFGVINFLLEQITRLMPGIIALQVISLIWSGSFSALFSMMKLIGLLVTGCILIVLIPLILISTRTKRNVFDVLKAMVPMMIIAFTTGSSSASYVTASKIAKEKLEISSSIVDFGLPLSLPLYKNAHAFYFFLILFGMAEEFSVPVSLPWILIAWIFCPILSIGSAPIPGAATAIYSILCTQFNIPLAALSLLVPTDIFTDMICTTSCMISRILLLWDFDTTKKSDRAG